MDIQTVGVAIGVSTLVGSALLYVIRAEKSRDVARLDGRIDSHEAACEERQKKLDERHENIERTLTRMDGKLDAIARVIPVAYRSTDHPS